jgi:hypothetical protein
MGETMDAAEPPSLVSPLDAPNDDFASIDHSSVAAYVLPMMLDSIRKSTISALEGVRQQTSQPPSQKKRKRLNDMYETVAKLTVRNQFLQAGASASMITRVPLGDVLKVFKEEKEEKDDGGDGEDYSELLNPPPPPYLHPYDNAQLATALRMARAAEENARKALDPRLQIEERKKKELVEVRVCEEQLSQQLCVLDIVVYSQKYVSVRNVAAANFCAVSNSTSSPFPSGLQNRWNNNGAVSKGQQRCAGGEAAHEGFREGGQVLLCGFRPSRAGYRK